MTTQQRNCSLSLTTHAVVVGYSIDYCDNCIRLEIKTDSHKRKFIESFYINSLSNVLNDKKFVCFPSAYQNLYHKNFFRFSTFKETFKDSVVLSSAILGALILLIVSGDLIFLRCLYFFTF